MNPTSGVIGVHDAGGMTDYGAELSLENGLAKSKTAYAQWEIETCATAILLSKRGVRVVDESRRTMEALPPARYLRTSYWAKWACGTAQLSLNAKLFTQAELDTALGSEGPSALAAAQPATRQFCVGAAVRVRAEADQVRWRRPHLRTPGYVHGAEGRVVRVSGPFANPEEVSFFLHAPMRTDAFLYTIRFLQSEVWPLYTGSANDTVDVDVYEAWLVDAERAATAGNAAATANPGGGGGWAGRGSLLVPLPAGKDYTSGGDAAEEPPRKKAARRVGGDESGGAVASSGTAQHQGGDDPHNDGHGHAHAHSHSHGHGHGHDGHGHAHDARPVVEQVSVDKEARHYDDDGPFIALHAATVGLLVSKGLFTRLEIRRQVEMLDEMAYGQTMEGAKLVATAWCDPSFKALLLSDAAAAVQQAGLQAVVDARGGIGSTRAGLAHLEYMGTTERGAPAQAVAPIGDTALVVVENTDEVHNLVVCTLCSCYPRALLGLPPRYFTSRAYRARGVREPRAVLAEFGCALPPTNTTVRVHDSTADVRFLVLPQRPAGTEGWTVSQLMQIATRDTLVGVAQPCAQIAVVSAESSAYPAPAAAAVAATSAPPV